MGIFLPLQSSQPSTSSRTYFISAVCYEYEKRCMQQVKQPVEERTIVFVPELMYLIAVSLLVIQKSINKNARNCIKEIRTILPGLLNHISGL